ncbi:MAG: ATP-binding cassette domain-containing protein [Aestuariivita sp.]|nr:ATP-binding cassette domain-containing protein [Aestuariivita sp.]MCY4347705.1 ATP-binding cassette domain-containing protein [Aestuariivita sp.]
MPKCDAKRQSSLGEVIDSKIELPLISARDIGFSLNGQWFLKDVSITVRARKRTVLIGPNGAGKSLLLRLFHGLIPASTGEILWKGQKLSSNSQECQAMVFQRPVMLRRSVMANMRFVLGVRGFAGREQTRRAKDALEMAGLTSLASRPARVLSGGEQQCLAVARALACGPELLLLDEPTASLDPAATSRVEELITAAHERGIAVVMVTHDQGQARRMADQLVFLQSGRVAEAGDAAAMFATPKSPALRAWLDGRLFVETEAN